MKSKNNWVVLVKNDDDATDAFGPFSKEEAQEVAAQWDKEFGPDLPACALELGNRAQFNSFLKDLIS
jgi:hypothetical protein